MKKFLGLLTMVVMFTVAYFVAMSFNPQWEKSNGEYVTGGADCYAFLYNQCTGGTTDCGAVTCSSTDGGGTWTCNSSSVTVKTNSSYSSDCPKTELGGWSSCTTQQLECSKTKTCSVFCTRNQATGIYYCSGSTGSQPNNVTHHYPPNGANQCN